MRLLLVLALLPVAGQVPADRDPAAPSQAVDPSSPSAEPGMTGSVEVGYRWRTDVRGSLDTYRSVVDLGEGPKLLGAGFLLADPAVHWTDRLEIRARNWGDDPYSTASIAARKQRLYDFSADYRNLAYFNALPSFANPFLGRGVQLNERSFDIRRRTAALRLDLRPASGLAPYLAYERSSGYGRGVTTFVSDANEYAVPTILRDANDTYRGGLRLEGARLHASGELGRTVFKEDQQVFESSPRNPGNRTATYLGRQLFLTDLQEAYGIRARGLFSKGLFTSNPLSWLDVYGNFSYSRPETATRFQRFSSGLFTDLSTALFTTTQRLALASSARMPHTAGSAGVEIRPVARTRVLLSWLTDRIDNAGLSDFTALLKSDYSQADAGLIFELNRQWTVRAGYRYVWGAARVTVTPEAGLSAAENARVRRSVGKGGFTYRIGSRLSASSDFEAATSSRVYFRTGLYDYRKMKVRARYQTSSALSLWLDAGLLNNQNAAPGADYDFRSRSASVGLHWAPGQLHGVQVEGTFSRLTLRSGTTYIAPQFLQPERSEYRDNAHIIDGSIHIPLGTRAGVDSRLSLGGSFFFSSGSRPTQHYQPAGSFQLPVSKVLTWTSEWRYHGFSQAVYGLEAFRTHLIATGLRIQL